MKTIILKVQIKIDTDDEDTIEQLIDSIETPIEDENGPLDHLKKYNYEIMILDRSDKQTKTNQHGKR
jgi:hypothetical protein